MTSILLNFIAPSIREGNNMTHRKLIFVIFVIGLLGNAGAQVQATEFFLRDDGTFDKDIPLDVLDPAASTIPVA